MKFSSKKHRTAEERREALEALQERKCADEVRRRDDDRSFSLEGLRFTALLSQLQALQAIQGLTEFKPRGRGGPRFEVPEDPKERGKQRQWLQFKADWLEAMLEDTLDALSVMDGCEDAESVTQGEEPES
jgi:hypothetical protein